jgi:hypothetical protein
VFSSGEEHNANKWVSYCTSEQNFFFLKMETGAEPSLCFQEREKTKTGGKYDA